MKDHSQERTMSENEKRLSKLQPLNSIILLSSYALAGLFFYNIWGWLGILLAIPVGMIAGIIISGSVMRVLFTKE